MDGRIPRNVYGNLDVYVPSMVPPGGAHIPHPDTAQAARIIGIDYADAITGFSFQGRHGTAVTKGAVVAAEYQEAIEEVIKAFEDERAQAEEERRSLTALKMWKRFLVALRIRERIEGYDIEGERDAAMRYEIEKAEEDDDDNDEGGGFLPDRDADEIAQPTAKKILMRNASDLGNTDGGGGFYISEGEQGEPEASPAFSRSSNRVHDVENDDTGGFELDSPERDARRESSEKNYLGKSQEDNKPAILVSAEIDSLGGGFVPDDDDARQNQPADDSTKPSKLLDGMLEDHGSINAHVIPQNEEQLEKAFPDLPAGELQEARMSQQLYESQGSAHLPIAEKDVTVSLTSKSRQTSPVLGTTAASEREASATPSEAYHSNERVPENESPPDSSEEDKGSLLSHDPDDEDADPEWLA